MTETISVTQEGDPGMPAAGAAQPGTAPEAESPAGIPAPSAPQEAPQDQIQQEQSRTLLALKEALLRANPLIPAEMLDAGSLDSLQASLRSAEQMVGRVRQRLEEEQRSAAQAWRVPAGAPVRRGLDLDSLSPAEKIRHGLSQKLRG
jgi:hypothetical protein